ASWPVAQARLFTGTARGYVTDWQADRRKEGVGPERIRSRDGARKYSSTHRQGDEIALASVRPGVQAEDLITCRFGRVPVDCDSVAAELNLSARSFRRRLMDEGTSTLHWPVWQS
ncbi:MAG TPA: hypothetical protein VJU59_39775, partial [Paraburkholderia sp.]|uniref:hypothetical protein n=1 Tax=Paraburkholderia sp. TaxID=1926495 RepID=UPI002B487B5A